MDTPADTRTTARPPKPERIRTCRPAVVPETRDTGRRPDTAPEANIVRGED